MMDLLPVMTCWPHDGGPFITLPIVITKDPDNGIQNAGMYRMQKFDNCLHGHALAVQQGRRAPLR